MDDIGKAIREARTKANLKQRELAAKLSVSEAMVCQWETGKRIPKKETIEKIAKGLGISPFELIGAEWFDIQLGPEKLEELREDISQLQAFEQYLKTLGYSVSYEGSSDTEVPDIVLIKGKEKTTFTSDQFTQFEKAISDSVTYQVWQQRKQK